VAEMMQTEYFIILFFVPFVFLGLLFEEIRMSKFNKVIYKAPLVLSIILIAFALVKDYKAAAQYANGTENNSRNSTLGEIESMSKFIISNSGDSTRVYFSGEKNLYSRYYKPLTYFVERSVDVTLLDSSLKWIYVVGDREKIKPSAGIPIFYIQDNTTKKSTPGEITKNHEIIRGQKFSSQTILILNN
jgi:hypothetical protein